MAKEVTMYQAVDGNVYDTKQACVDHERKLEDNDRIERFLKSKHNVYDKSAHLTVAENTLQAFAAWNRGDKPKEKAFDAEEATDGKLPS